MEIEISDFTGKYSKFISWENDNLSKKKISIIFWSGSLGASLAKEISDKSWMSNCQ